MKKILLSALFAFCLLAFQAFAGPPGSPPIDGVGTDGAQGLIIQGDTITIGGSSSAIKDNAGTLQISNGGGAFANIGTASASISDAAYDSTTWDGVTTDGASKNAIRDKIEALDAAKQDALSTVSQAVAEAGTSTTAVLYTPERVAQAIAALGNDLSETDIDTLAELNAILTDATLLDDGAIADSTAIGLNTGATYTNFGVVGDDSLNEMFAAIDGALATAGGDNLGSASASDVAALFSGSGTYLKSDGSQGDPVDWTADQGGAEVHVNNLPTNAADSAGIVASGAAQVNKVWKTDADGIPAWRDDSTGGTPTFDTVGTGTNVTSTMTVGAGSTLTFTGSGVLNASQYKGSGTPSATEFGYLSGVTSAIQTQLNGKQAASANLDGWSALATSAKQDASANLSGWSAIATSAKQDADTELSAIAGLTSAANALPYFTGSGTAATTTMTAAGRALLDDNDAAAMRTTLGLAIGTDVQEHDDDLTIYAGITPSADVQSLLGAANYSAMRTQLSLVPGTNVQNYDEELAALAGLTSAANALPYFTGSGTAAVTTLSAAGRALIDDASASDMRTTLGLVIGTNVQGANEHLDDLSDGTLAGSKVDVATTSAVGVVELSTDDESVTGTSDAVVVTPGTLTARLAAPGAIGGTTPNAGTFTTLNAGGTGFEVDADGDTTVKSWNIRKTSGVAGSFLLKEANLLDEDGAGFKGPASVAANTSYQGQLPNARPSSDNSVMAWSDTASGGDGTPNDPFVHPLTFISLDDYLPLAGGTMTGPLVTAASATGGAGINIPHGTAPTAPDNGDLWTTTSGVYARINGGTVGPFGTSAADVTGGSASASTEIASYTDTTGKAIGRTFIAFSGPASTLKTKTIGNTNDTILELGGSYAPTGVWDWTSATGTWPTFNQNTTGTAAGLTAQYIDWNSASGGSSIANKPTIPTASSLSVDDIITLSGVAEGSTHLGTFTGTTITDSSTIKTALQELETAVEGAGDGHSAVTLSTAADTVLSLSTQEIGLDTQTANYGFFGPTTGAAAAPTFRAMVAADIPDWYAYDVLPVAWAADGTAAPDALDDRSTRKPYQYRTFAHDSTEDVNFTWFVPSDLSGDTTAIQYRVKYLVTAATGPSNEGLAFTLAGVSLGDNDATNGTKGTAVTVTDTAITAAQHDILITDWSGDVTVTNLAAGEIAELAFTRDHDHASDDYAQVVGVLAVEIRYVRNVAR